MNPKEIPDYSFKYYQDQNISRKRQIIDRQLEMLHETHMQMIEEALAYSDMQQAKEIIQWIMVKQ